MTRNTIYTVIILYLFASAFRLGTAVIADKFGVWDLISVGIGVFILYSLLQAKVWAKTYITLICAVVIALVLVSLIGYLMDGDLLQAIPLFVLVNSFGYLLLFLNNDDRYANYVRLVNSGLDTSKSSLSSIDHIIAPERLVSLDRRDFPNGAQYLALAQTLFLTSTHDLREKTFELEGKELFVHLNGTEYAIAFDDSTGFFDVNIIPQFTQMLQRAGYPLSVSLVYPNTTAFRTEVKIACLSDDQLSELKQNGMIEKQVK